LTLSDRFRELLKKVGSGPHTSKDLTRTEAKNALRWILEAEATPAQIGAFFISHRIKRPTGDELAGFLDALEALGPQIPPIENESPVVVFSNPYDGRSRTAPLSPITSLMLAAAEVPVLMHGSGVMPTKYGIPLIDVWLMLGVDWHQTSLVKIASTLQSHKIGFLHMGDHFPQFEALTPYRDQIGKRPPLAMAELLWCPYGGKARLVSGYVHPPTETKLQRAFHCRNQQHYTTVKGLEGSSDLPRDRTAIIGIHHPQKPELERLLLHARDYGLGGTEIPYDSPEQLSIQMNQLLQGEASALLPGVIWNGGFYLWHFGPCDSLEAGIDLARQLIQNGQLLTQLQGLQAQLKVDDCVTQ
jgi:anthranilate phosphoribosyltransferase